MSAFPPTVFWGGGSVSPFQPSSCVSKQTHRITNNQSFRVAHALATSRIELQGLLRNNSCDPSGRLQDTLGPKRPPKVMLGVPEKSRKVCRLQEKALPNVAFGGFLGLVKMFLTLWTRRPRRTLGFRPGGPGDLCSGCPRQDNGQDACARKSSN